MAQYDLVLLQNRADPGPEFDEYLLTGVRGGVIAFIGTTVVPTVISGGSEDDVLSIDSNGDAVWGSVPGGTHAAITLAASADVLLDVSGGQELSLDTQPDHNFLAGPLTGGPLAPTWRVLHADDIPDLSGTYLTSETSHSDVVVDGDFGTDGILIRTAAATYSALTGSSAIDTVEASLTDDVTHMPTSAAVFAALHSAVTLQTALNTNLLSLSGQELQLDTQAANIVFAGPTSSTAAPTFRSLVAGDIPDLSGSYLTSSDITDMVEHADFSSDGILIRTAASTYSILTGSDPITAIQTTITDIDTAIPTSGAVVDYIADGLAANDAMIFKGTVGSGGTLTLAAHDALTTYNSGWTYRVIEASSDLWGKVVEIGDLIIAIVNRTGSGNTDADWTVAQTNVDGAVVDGDFNSNYSILRADSSGTPTALVVSASTFVGRAAAGGIVALSASDARTVLGLTAIYVEEANFTAQTILAAISSGDPQPLTVAEQTLVGRVSGGDVDALVADLEVMPMMWRTLAPSTSTSTGTRGQIHEDDNYLYICTATDVWKRCALATNWT